MAIPIARACSVVHCGQPVVGQNLCAKHYKQMQRHGAPSKEVSAKLINGEKLNKHPLYTTWRSITRIAMGTQICEEWKNFEVFVVDVGKKPEKARSLRRLDPCKPFSKDNVRWQILETSEQAREKQVERMQKFYAANPDYARWASIKSMYGLTKEQYLELSAKQNDVCAICHKPEKRTTKSGETMNLHIDHCHDSKKVRGLLCSACNTAIGLLGEDHNLLKAAIEYLGRE